MVSLTLVMVNTHDGFVALQPNETRLATPDLMALPASSMRPESAGPK
jgi:hypothetical protein